MNYKCQLVTKRYYGMAGNGFTVMSFFVGKDEVNDRICHGDFL